MDPLNFTIRFRRKKGIEQCGFSDRYDVILRLLPMQNKNKKAFQKDAYRPLRFPPLDVSPGSVPSGACTLWAGGVPPGIPLPPGRNIGPGIPTHPVDRQTPVIQAMV